MDSKAHWEQVYETKRSDEVSWYQADPTTSLALIQRVAPDRSVCILDVGAGTSLLVDRLLAAGYARVTVLDLSGTALKAVGDRLPPELRSRVKLIEADVLKTELPPHSVDVWHDRAVFHFLIERADRCAYVAQVQRALRPGGHVIVSTFAEDGPTTCSGLPVARYDSAGLHAIFGARFELLDSVREQHITPSGGRQAFQYCVCRMRAASSQAA